MRVVASGTIFDADEAPDGQKSNAFTSLTRLSSGAYLAAFRTAPGRDLPGGRVRIMGSDDGTSWTMKHPGLTATIDGIAGDMYAGYVTELAPGQLLGGFLWVDRSDPDRSFVHPETAGILPTRTLLAESNDEGATWSAFREVDLSPETGCSITGPIFRLAGGALALPYETWKAYDDPSPGKHTSSLRLSLDSGTTWPERAIVAADPEARIFYWDQRIAAHPDTGGLVAMFWTHDRSRGVDLENHIAWADPSGTIWGEPQPTGLRGQHCQPLPLGADHLAAVYVQRTDPPAIRMTLSRDFGRTWDTANTLTIYEHPYPDRHSEESRPFEEFWRDMMQWQFGHPRAVLDPDGRALVAWYGGDRHGTSMRWAIIDLDTETEDTAR
jgi:hypothetical protein